MKELSKLHPAQTLLLIEGRNAEQKDLLKYTFMDLLLKKVLKTMKKSYRPSKYDPVQTITYVSTGDNFSSYKYAPHEHVFLKPFQERSSIAKLMFRHVVKMGYQNSKYTRHYQNLIADTFELRQFVDSGVISILFGRFALSPAGKEMKDVLKGELKYLDEHLPDLIQRDKQKALEVLRIIKGNIFLLKNIDFKLLADIDKELMDEMHPRRGYGDSGCSGCVSTWDSFGHDWNTFDSNCSSGNSGCGGSGCSGGGCSGCSGCGGCGS
jgi:hypothetical protein